MPTFLRTFAWFACLSMMGTTLLESLNHESSLEELIKENMIVAFMPKE